MGRPGSAVTGRYTAGPGSGAHRRSPPARRKTLKLFCCMPGRVAASGLQASCAGRWGARHGQAAGDRGAGKHFGPITAVDGVSFTRRARRGAGLPRAERRRQVDHDAHDHGLPAARRRPGRGLRHRPRARPDRGPAADRLSARGRARLRRHDAVGPARLRRRRCAASRRERQAPSDRRGDRAPRSSKRSCSSRSRPSPRASSAGSASRSRCCTTPRC